ncbi:hypothetical protein PS15m_006615 [Mucor circinelloides]
MPEYTNFTEKYNIIQMQTFLTGTSIKQIFKELDALSFRENRDKIKYLLVELSAGEDNAAMSKVFNRTTRFADNSTTRYMYQDLVKNNVDAAELEELAFQKALMQYYDMFFQLRKSIYGMGALGGYDPRNSRHILV